MKTTACTLLYRIRSSAPWALRHLSFSIVIAVLVALLVIGIWFPSPFAEISGGLSLFLWIMAVDVTCGPMLTLLLLHPGKSRKALLVDIGLIGVVQLSALIYGMHTLSQARPIALVFEVDRFRVVSYADLDISNSENLPDWVRPWSIEPLRVLGVRSALTAEEKWKSLDASLQGIEPSQRPSWWQGYEHSILQVKERAKPLELLLSMHPQERQRIQAAASQAAEKPFEHETSCPEEFLWLPVVGRQFMDWVVLIDPQSARIRGYVHVDGFPLHEANTPT